MLKLWVGYPVFYVRVAPHAMIVKIIKLDFSYYGNFNRLCKKKKILNFYSSFVITVNPHLLSKFIL
jgi:hypothetical protein